MTTETTEYARNAEKLDAIQTEIDTMRTELRTIPMVRCTVAQWARRTSLIAAIDAMQNLQNRIADSMSTLPAEGVEDGN